MGRVDARDERAWSSARRRSLQRFQYGQMSIGSACDNLRKVLRLQALRRGEQLAVRAELEDRGRPRVASAEPGRAIQLDPCHCGKDERLESSIGPPTCREMCTQLGFRRCRLS
jgi:hypothetical protein